jgi:hypothetical protein
VRNYVKELQSIGYTVQAISKQTGLSQRYIYSISTGKIVPKSRAPAYEKIRTVNRRLATEYLRSKGVPSKKALELRRSFLNKERKPMIKNTIQKIKSKRAQNVRQYYIYGEFRYAKDDSISHKFEYGFSRSTHSHNTSNLRAKAIENAKARLGGTNWALIPPLLEEGYTTYELTDSQT